VSHDAQTSKDHGGVGARALCRMGGARRVVVSGATDRAFSGEGAATGRAAVEPLRRGGSRPLSVAQRSTVIVAGLVFDDAEVLGPFSRQGVRLDGGERSRAALSTGRAALRGVTSSLWLVGLLTSLAACTGTITMPGAAPGEPVFDGGLLADGGCAPVSRNDEVRLALAGACAGCHLTGSLPYWASLEAFEAGLVDDPRFVTPGDPDGSRLLQLIKATASGTFTQMPPGETYASLLERGRATLSIAELEAWVRALPPTGSRPAEPSPDRFTVRRLSAEEMVVSAMAQLGLTLEDFVDTSSPRWRDEAFTVRGGRFFIWPKDWAPGISGQYVSDSRTVERYEALGGMARLDNRGRDTTLGPAAVQTLVQMSQAWCQRAVDKPGNTAVLRHVTLADRSATKAADIKRNLSALHLRMLSEPASEAAVDALYTKVYLPAEASSTRAAWTAVCASFMRHPQWLSF
jgi:hypothetical protein